MLSVLDVGSDDLDRLSDSEAANVFAILLWADSSAYGIPAEIDAPRRAPARGGGVVATVRAPADIEGRGVIRPGVTRYLVRSGRGFDPANRGARRRLLFRQAGGGLRPLIKNCLDRGETLVVALFGASAPGAGRDPADLIREDLAGVDPSYGDARVEVWRQDEMIRHVSRHPVIQRRLKGMSDVPFLTHRRWASMSMDMTRPFVLGRPQGMLIDRARAALRNTTARADVRIVGRPGGGKTRIAHEITRAGDLAPFVLYFESPSHIRHGGFLTRLHEDDDVRAILVVDKCDTANWLYLQDRTANAGGRVGLVTVYDKRDGEDCYDLEDLGPEEIRRIVAGYGAEVPGDAVDRLASACGPSPRYAHHFAEIMESDPGGFPRRLLSEDAIHELYIGAGLGPLASGMAEKRKLVLLQFCIFSRVGFRGPRSDEYEFLRKKSGQYDGIAPHAFDAIVDELRKLKILRGHEELRITPRMLHLWLWGEWWRLCGSSLAPDALPYGDGAVGMPDALKKSFLEMAPADPRPKIVAGVCAPPQGTDRVPSPR